METQITGATEELRDEQDISSLLDDVDAAIGDAYAALPVGSDQQNQNYRDR
jgi:hypothetical protein